LLQNKNTEEIVSIVNYLDNTHGFNALQPWFSQNFDSLFTLTDSIKYVNKGQTILNLIGVENYYGYSYEGKKNFYIHSENSDNNNLALTVKGFDYFATFSAYIYDNYTNNDYQNSIIIEKDTLYLKYKANELLLYKNNNLMKRVDFINYAKELKKNSTLRHEDYIALEQQLSLPIETDSLFVQLNFTTIQGTTDENDSLSISNINANVLIKRK
jgi:hypothetical protein